MKRTIQVRIFWGETQYVAECMDLPVVTQAPTLDELAANIREAIALHLEGEDLEQLGLTPQCSDHCDDGVGPSCIMPKLKNLSGADLLSIFAAMGFEVVSQRGAI